jgi:hypothetical protein
MKKVFILLDHKHDRLDDHSAAIIYWYGILDNMGYDVSYIDYANYNADSLYNEIRQEKPFMLILVNYFRTIHTEFARFRDITKVYLLQSDMHRFYDNHVKLWIPYVDGIINFEGTKERCLRDGLPENGFLKMRWGFNPNMMCISSREKNRSISFYGGLHGGRAQLLQNLSQLTSVDVIPQSATYGQVKYILSESKFSLNLSMNATGDRRELKGRVVEIPAHCVLLSEPAPELETYYNEDEYILFNSIEELADKIKSLSDKEVEDIFKRGNKALWERNTAYHEWDKILPFMDPDYKPIAISTLLRTHHSDYYHG